MLKSFTSTVLLVDASKLLIEWQNIVRSPQDMLPRLHPAQSEVSQYHPSQTRFDQ
jgi:hypothetical protein